MFIEFVAYCKDLPMSLMENRLYMGGIYLAITMYSFLLPLAQHHPFDYYLTFYTVSFLQQDECRCTTKAIIIKLSAVIVRHGSRNRVS
jgi:hypothetical protein